MQIGSLEGWENWTDSGCERLALEVAKQKGRQYALIYAHWKKPTARIRRSIIVLA